MNSTKVVENLTRELRLKNPDNMGGHTEIQVTPFYAADEDDDAAPYSFRVVFQHVTFNQHQRVTHEYTHTIGRDSATKILALFGGFPNEW